MHSNTWLSYLSNSNSQAFFGCCYFPLDSRHFLSLFHPQNSAALLIILATQRNNNNNKESLFYFLIDQMPRDIVI